MSYRDDFVLLEKLQKGEEKAYIHIVEVYGQKLFTYATSLTNDQGLAQDIVQNVFLKTWERRRKLNIISSLQNYLLKSVHNEFLNQYRDSKATLVLEKQYFETLSKVAGTYDEISFIKITELIKREIQKLPPRCKEVFLLSRHDGLTNIEISQYLKVTVKTVEAQITKAFSVLRKRLGHQYDTFLFLNIGNTN